MHTLFCPDDGLLEKRLQIVREMECAIAHRVLEIPDMSSHHTTLANIKNFCATLRADGIYLFSLVSVGRRILPIPQTGEEAVTHLKLISGRRHRVYTVLMVVQGQKRALKIAQTMVRVKCLTVQEILDYGAAHHWQGRLGGYLGVESFLKYILSVNGHPCWMMGVPLYEFSQMAKTLRLL